MNNIPILFLDIDGVMNTTRTINRHRTNEVFSAEAVKSLLRIVCATNCRIVISSSWRSDRMDRIGTLLAEHGLAVAAVRIIGATPILDPTDLPTREDEIECWLKQNKYSGHFAIIDDEPILGPLRPWAVQTSEATGLTSALANQAIELLTNGCAASKRPRRTSRKKL